jgi:acyl transferase domain-containing protein
MTRDRSLDVAVTGMAARFPGSANLAEWWSALTGGRVLTTRYDRDELRAAGVPEELADHPDYVPVRGHLPGIHHFDNTLFRVSPRDAEMTDPQQRMMLEVAYAALEDAAVNPLRTALTTGVYASATGSGYLRAMLYGGQLDPQTLDDAVHGSEPDFMASRIAYKLGLTGPAVAVQTACSSSLVAVHLAVQALLNGECDQAVVVAAGLDYPQGGHLYVDGGIHSRSGRCLPFDAAADGVVAGSGVCCVVLRRLADAQASGPRPYGVVVGSAVNNDGAAKVGYYAPSVSGQEKVIRAALDAADVDAASVGYLEAHATGTKVGDPIEWAAASAAYGGLGAAPGQIAVGALKANMGHLDAAAGVAALIKALLVVGQGIVPPVAGFCALNPLLDTEGSPLWVPTEATPWTSTGPRRAGVSSFGIGGTNAHVIIEQAPETTAPSPVPEGAARLVLLSAGGEDALDRTAARLAAHLDTERSSLADTCHTLAVGRAVLAERMATAGRTTTEVAAALRDGDTVRGRCPEDGPAQVVFVFPGQGAQHPGMAGPFVEALPGFADAMERCLAAFPPDLAGRLLAALLDPARPAAELAATELAQPALFTVEYAAATALTALGVRPAAVAGHSLGEITAACVAGVLDLPTAAGFVAIRGAAMQSCPPGAMLALGCAEASARELVEASGTGLELAAVNTPDSCVMAGPVEAVEAFRTWLGGRVAATVLHTSHAFHSALIEPALAPLADALAGVRPGRAAVRLARGVDGSLVEIGDAMGVGDFVTSARQPVRFAAAVASIARRHPGAVVVEVGPRRGLSAMVEAAGLTAVPLSPARDRDPAVGLLTALGRLWTLGQPLDPAALCPAGRPIHLPGYPFAGPAWIAPEVTAHLGPAATTAEPAAGPEVPAVVLEPPALLAALWTETLGHAELGADADFFRLGGDSLLITRLARRIDQELGVRVPLRALLTSRTLGRQTEIVLELLAERSHVVEPAASA